MKKNNDLVSIIIACYNIEDYVEKCLESIKNQSYTNIEVLMVDDGSKDNTGIILKKYELSDARFIYLRKKNGGLSDARNYGINKATGNYVVFIDGDDYIEDDYVEELLDSIKKNNSDISVCYFNRVYGRRIKINKVGIEKYNIIKHPAAWNKMYKKSIFEHIEFKKGVWYEDLNLFSKVLLSNPVISIVDKPLYNYIQNASSIMHTYDKRIYQMYDVIEDIEQYAKRNNLYNENKELIEYLYIYHVLIGTIYRQSFSSSFTKNDVNDICSFVLDKYSDWYHNIYIKKLPFIYRIYLLFLKRRYYGFVYFIIKRINKYINL